MYAAGIIVTALILCVFSSNAAKLPSYITACSRNDPMLNGCALKRSREVLKSALIKKGDPKYHVPVMDPFFISKMQIDTAGLTITHTDMEMIGMEDVIVNDIRIDLKKRHEEVDITVPHLRINAKYEVSGRLLILPIIGNGIFNLTLTNSSTTVSHDFNLKKKKNGKTYMVFKNTEFRSSNPAMMTIHMSNLFNGDKLLGDNMNVFMNENWRDLLKELGPYYDEALAQVAQQIYNGLTSAVPYDEIYPEKV